MRTLTSPRALAGAALGLALAASPLARAGETSGAGGDHGAAGWKTLDTSGDGKLSRDEHAAGARRMFETMDGDRDSKVTAAEMDAAREKITGKKAASEGELTAADKIKVVDANGDGVLTAEEHAQGSRRMFDEMDADRDGTLTRAEFGAGHAKLHPGAK
jgi:hypothetical protein